MTLGLNLGLFVGKQIGVLGGSLVSALAGYAALRVASSRHQSTQQAAPGR